MMIHLRQGWVKEGRNLHENLAYSLYDAKSHINAGMQGTQIQKCFYYSYVIHFAADFNKTFRNFSLFRSGSKD